MAPGSHLFRLSSSCSSPLVGHRSCPASVLAKLTFVLSHACILLFSSFLFLIKMIGQHLPVGAAL
jgi:hypothetical protein